MTDIVFSAPPPPPGKGRPGVSRPAFTAPTDRQPNRGLTDADPEFTCSVCRKTIPMEEAHRVKTKGGGARRTGRCVPCAQQKQREANDRQAAKRRGPDYVLLVPKDVLFPVVDGQRTCSVCSETKALEEFYVDRSVTSGFQNACKVCRSGERRDRWQALSPEQQQVIKDHQWRMWIWRRFWLTPEAYDAKLLAQGGVCAICKLTSDKRLCVDHDHNCCPSEYTCGECVRDLLCHMCNFVIGHIETRGIDPATLDAFLSRHAKD